MKELMLTSNLTDGKRLKEILAENNSRMQEYMLDGIGQYRLTQELETGFQEKKEGLVEKLQTLCKMIFRPENLLVDFTGSQEAFKSLEDPIADLNEALYTCEVEKAAFAPALIKKNEGFMNAGQVQYVCRAGNFLRKGLPYTGVLNVLKVMMGYEYLWTNIRVKGGAYGCMCGFARNGASYFVSYRDPNLGQTVDVYEKAAEFIANYEADERTMTQYIIGTFSNIDMPLTASAKGRRSKVAYMTGVTIEMIQKERDEVLQVTPEQIRELSKYIEAFMEDDCFCVVGNEQKIRSEESKFLKLENLN